MKNLFSFPLQISIVKIKKQYLCYTKSVIIFLIPYFVFLQNLVPNHSFEDYDTCPTIMNFQYGIQMCSFWENGSISGTPDYYHECGETIPSVNSITYQQPIEGNAYVGIWGNKLIHQGIPISNLREYLMVELTYSCEIGKCYFASFFVNNSNFSVLGINNLGMMFTLNAPILLNDEPYLIEGNPQINCKKIISDTINWVKISGIVQAQGGEQYLTIGNFFQDSETNFVQFLDLPNVDMIGAYYLIDDVSVIPIDSLPGGTLAPFAGEDRSIFIGDSTMLGQDVSNLNCTWYVLGSSTPLVNSSPYESSIYVSPTDTTTYVVMQNLCGVISYDTVTVFPVLKPPTIGVQGSLTFCEGDSVVLSCNVAEGIVWSSGGETTQSITVSEAGSYSVTQTFNEYIASSEPVIVNVLPALNVNLAAFEPLCDTSAILTFNQGTPVGGTYYVNNVEQSTFNPSNYEPGVYTISYSYNDGTCEQTVSTDLTLLGCSVGLDENLFSPFGGGQGGGFFKIIPNPNNGSFTIQTNSLEIQELTLYDAQGRKLYDLDKNSTKVELNLPKGVYFLEIISENSRNIEKIVVN